MSAPYIRGRHQTPDIWDVIASGEMMHPGNMYGSPCLTTWDSLHLYYSGYEPVSVLGINVGDYPPGRATGPMARQATHDLHRCQGHQQPRSHR